MLFRTALFALFAASANAWGSSGCPDDCDACYWAGQCYGQSGSCSAGVTDCGGGGGGCTNTSPDGGQDDGCESDEPLCVYSHNLALIEASGAAGVCAKCVNSKRGGGGLDALDYGCTDDMPVCVRGNDEYFDLHALGAGSECAVCFNSLDSDEACDLDDGCPPSKPDCYKDGMSPPIWAPGNECVANCKNTEDGDGTDYGCHDDYPFCVIGEDNLDVPLGEYGDSCSVCSLEFCTDDVQCTIDSCDVDAGCSNTPDDTLCDDEVGCTVDACDPIMGCSNTPDDGACDDEVGCTIDACDPVAGCSSTPDDTLCDDEVGCTIDACDPIEGCSSTPDDGACDDGVSCTVDECDPIEGCSSTPDDGACDDGVACTVDECDASFGCSFSPDNTLCDDGNECTQNICTQTGCEFPPVPPGIPCQDGACFNGECSCVPGPNTGCEPGDICLEPPTPGNPQCVPCVNDKTGMGMDLGCDDATPACVMDNGMEPATGGVGAKCAPCVNDATFSDSDQGCDDKGNKKICVDSSTKTSPASGVEGNICARCLNTDSDTGKDYGCNNNKKYCVFGDGEQPGSNEKGDKCSLCLNTKTDGTADPGCTNPDKPLCDADVGEGGDQCKECPPSPPEVSVCFAIDESGSINNSEFAQMTTFIMSLITSLSATATGGSEFAASQFAAGFSTLFTLTDAADAINKVNNNANSGGNTNIAGGIGKCVDLMDGTIGPTAQFSPKLLITITDGNPTAGGDIAVAANAAIANPIGLTLVAVGIGNGITLSNLQKIASSDDLVFQANSFSTVDLDQIKQEILDEVGCVE